MILDGPPPSVYVVDDAPEITDLTSHWLQKAGFETQTFSEPEPCLEALRQATPDAVCLDLNLPGMGGLEALEQIVKRDPLIPVVIMTSDSSVESVFATIEMGAYDYLVKPLDRSKLVEIMENAAQRHRTNVSLQRAAKDAGATGYPTIVGESEPMRALFRDLDRISPSDVSVLISGETGTGKELVARALRRASSRKDGSWVTVNCAAIPETLQESELFGHEKGSFTGAVRRHVGKFERADGGTLFLDEVAELSLPLQAKLLRALQERSFHRVGGETDLTSDFRLITASNKDLIDEVRAGRFREDLYFRIAVFELELPPLRERSGDLRLLAERFIADYAPDDGQGWRISDAALAILGLYEWPGNVRELQNAIQRAVVATGPSKVIRPAHLPPRLLGRSSVRHAAMAQDDRASGANVVRFDRALRSRESGGPTLREMERAAIAEAMGRYNGNVTEVCRELGLGRATVYRKLKKYELR